MHHALAYIILDAPRPSYGRPLIDHFQTYLMVKPFKNKSMMAILAISQTQNIIII